MLFLVAVVFFTAGCAANRVDLWPLFYREKDPRGIERGPKGTVKTEVTYPVFSMQSSPERHYHAVRPFYNYESTTDGKFAQCQFIWPLGLYRSRADIEKIVRLIPIFHYGKHRSTVNDEWQTRVFIFPLIHWGRAVPGGSYFAFFPIGGVIKNLFVERFAFALFPIWCQTKDKDYKRNDVLWPIVSWGGTADGRRRLLRIWPFYVHKGVRDKYDKYWVMWPFGLWGSENMKGEYPRSYGGVFPFYVGKVSKDRQGKTVAYDRRILYFLLVLRKDRRERHKMSAVAVLWPFTNFEKSRKKRDIRIWPLYWQTDRLSAKDENYLWRRRRILWPIIWIDHDKRDPDFQARDVLVVPFYWDYATRFSDDTRKRRVTFFPLYTFQRDRDGSVHHWILSHGWKDTTKGFKRNLRAFLDIFQYHSEADGTRSLRFLWRLFAWDREGDWRRLELGPFYSSERDKDYRRWSCVLGIISRESDAQNSRWRLFYIPFGKKIKRPNR